MIERLMEFLPSILVLFTIAVMSYFYMGFILPRWLGKENLKNNEWVKQWFKEHRGQALLLIALPSTIILAPAAEELVFRGPLIILFDTISGYSWLGIVISSMVFASLHYFGKFNERFVEGINYNIEDAFHETEADEDSRITRRKLIKTSRLIGPFGAGILSGYLGIKYQSLYLCLIIHAAWNLLIPIVLPILAIFIIFAATSIYLLANKILWWFKWDVKRKLRRRFPRKC